MQSVVEIFVNFVQMVTKGTGNDRFSIEVAFSLTLSDPGGGLRGPDGQTDNCQSGTSYPMMPKLGDF